MEMQPARLTEQPRDLRVRFHFISRTFRMAAHDDQSFEDYWYHYLRHHAHGGTRLMHVFGTVLGVSAVVVGIVTFKFWIAIAGIVLGYLFAWTGHFLIEGNRPVMVSNPLWALLCDLRMSRLWLTGRLAPELKKAGVG